MKRRNLIGASAAVLILATAGHGLAQSGDTIMHTVTSKDSTAIAYETMGDGPPLIFVHGAMQYRGIDPLTPQLAALLAHSFTVVQYDRRGRGQSGDTLPYAVQREIEDLAAVIEDIGGHASLLGMSSGSVLAIEAAANGLPIDKIAAYEPPFVVDDSRPGLPDDYVETLDGFIAQGKRGEAVEYFMTVAVGMPADQVDGMKASPFWSVMEGVAHTIAYDGRIMFGAFVDKELPVERWSAVTMPVLVLDGDASFAFTKAAADAVANALPNASRETLAGQTHGADPAVITPVLKSFLGS
jgi:pimeloyl-ACP methyl ester carboxylesterase